MSDEECHMPGMNQRVGAWMRAIPITQEQR
jgi:hypothetical protein